MQEDASAIPDNGGGGSPTGFFVLVLVLSVPIWLVAGGRELLPGVPASSLMLFTPMFAAGILVAREEGWWAVWKLLRRAVDARRIPGVAWFATALLLAPVLHVLGYVAMRVLGLPLPDPWFPVASVPLLAGVFFLAAVAEELGWSAYAVERGQEHCSALRTGLQVGMFWALWHVVPMAQVGRSAEWITGQVLFLVAFRVVLVWLYNNTRRSVFAVALCHATANLSWQLFPNQGSHYEPRLMALIAIVAAGVFAVGWGPATLARSRGR